MSHKADQERASKGIVHREGRLTTPAKCPIPGCQNHVDPQSPFQACTDCTKIINVMVFALPRIQIKERKLQSGLIVPTQSPIIAKTR